MMDLASHYLARSIIGAPVERTSSRVGYGDCGRASFRHKRSDEPGLLLMCHMDTVHPLASCRHCPATLDGLGTGGHTLEKHLLVDNLISRGRLPTGLIATPTP